MKGYKFGTAVVKFIDGQVKVLTACKGDHESICTGDPTPFLYVSPRGEKRLLWMYEFTYENLKLKDKYEFANGAILEIYKVGQQGDSIPDIATYWVACLDGVPYDLEYRTSMWRSDDSDYPNWIFRLKEALSAS